MCQVLFINMHARVRAYARAHVRARAASWWRQLVAAELCRQQGLGREIWETFESGYGGTILHDYIVKTKNLISGWRIFSTQQKNRHTFYCWSLIHNFFDCALRFFSTQQKILNLFVVKFDREVWL